MTKIDPVRAIAEDGATDPRMRIAFYVLLSYRAYFKANQGRSDSLDDLAKSAELWASWLAVPGKINSSTGQPFIVDYREVGLLDREGGFVSRSAVEQVAQFIWHHADQPPSLAKVLIHLQAQNYNQTRK